MIMLEYSNMMPFNHRNGICFSRFLDLKVFSFDQTFSESWVGAVFSFDQTFSKSLKGAVFGFDQTFSKSLEVKSCLHE